MDSVWSDMMWIGLGLGITNLRNAAFTPAAVTGFPLDTAWVTTTSGSTSVGSLAVNMAAHVAGDLLFNFVAMDDVATLTATAGWTVTQEADNGVYGTLWSVQKVAESSSETLTLTPSSAQTIAVAQKGLKGVRSGGAVRGTVASGTDPAAISWGSTEKALVLTAIEYSGEDANVTAAPAGFGAMSLTGTATNSGGVRLAVSAVNSESTGVDPGAWTGGTSAHCKTQTYAFLPTTGVTPVSTLSVSVSATNIVQGDSIEFTAEANGQPDLTYTLVIDGATYGQTVSNNYPVTFAPSLTTLGSKPWTLTASNAAGSAIATGSVDVTERLVFSVSSTDISTIMIDASSVAYGVTAESYELDYEPVDGSAATQTIAQASAAIELVVPLNTPYRFRSFAINGGARSAPSIWGYYCAMQVGTQGYPLENAVQTQIGHLSAVGPFEVVPVAGRQLRVHETFPKVERILWGTYNHWINGDWINPPMSGRPQAWDSRTGGKNILYPPDPGYFDPAKVNVTWPALLNIGDTLSKVSSRPQASLKDNNEGHRWGVIDQHGGFVVMNALSTLSPMQATPPIIKGADWAPNGVDLPGWSSMLGILTSTALSTAGMDVPDPATVRAKMLRFNPSLGVMRGNVHNISDNEAHSPYGCSMTYTVSNYRAFETDIYVAGLLISDAVDSTWKAEMLGAYVLAGLNSDYPGHSLRCGAGISQNLLLPVALSRIARGLDFLDLGTTQREVKPFMFGFWDATTLSYLAPHNVIDRPTFALRRQIISVSADATGYLLEVPFNLNARTGERKQDFNGLNIVFEAAANAELPYRDGKDGNWDGPTEIFKTTGFLGTAPVAGDYIYMKIPDADMENFVPGEPFWMYDETDAGGEYRWQSFNPSKTMSYRTIVQPQGDLVLLHALGAYPNVPGSNWDAMKQYTIKTKQVGWPSAAMDYSFTGSTFISQMWDAHAATLGITA